MAKIIAIKISKGGTGKTTTTANLGHTLAKKGNKVLLIDLDPQTNLSYLFTKNYEEDSVDTLTSSNLIADDIEDPNDLIFNIEENFDLIRADKGLNFALTDVVSRFPDKHHLILKNKLDELNISKVYDYIILDLSPGVLDAMTNMAFVASDKLITPIHLDDESLQGLTSTLFHLHDLYNEEITKMSIKDVIVVPNKYNKTERVVNDEILKMMKESLNHQTISDPIRQNSNYKKSSLGGMTAIDYENNPELNKYGHKRAVEDFNKLAELIIKGK